MLMNLAQLCKSAANGEQFDIPENWLQGRTAYGGLSAALALNSARSAFDGDLPLRSAQCAFVGPLAGQASAKSTLLRRGKNSAYVETELAAADNITLKSTFIFTARRDSEIQLAEATPSDLPEFADEIGEHSSRSPAFFREQIEVAGHRLREAVRPDGISAWLRFKDREGVDPESELMAMGDALPPAMMGSLPPTAMISSMNWQVNITAHEIATTDGWWLVDTRVEHAADGSSSQRMRVWNRDLQLMMTGMQSVAYYA